MGHWLADWIGYLVLKGIAFLINCLPLRVALGLGHICGAISYYFHKRNEVAYVNLKAAFGSLYSPRERKRIARTSYINLAQNAIEMFRIPRITKEYVDKYIQIEGYERIAQALEKGKGLIFLTAHFGNWELLGVASALKNYPLKVLARQQKHSRMNDLLNDFRSAHGNQVIGKGMAIREIMSALKHNDIVGILSDQSGGPGGVYVDFFGRKTSSPPGAISIALRTECVILPAFMIRYPHGYHRICINEPLRLAESDNQDAAISDGLQQYLRMLENYIHKYPNQWLWMHKRWKHNLNRTIVILTDKKAGHESQSSAVSAIFDRIGKANKLTIKTKKVEIAYKNKLCRKILFLITPVLRYFVQGRLPLLRHVLTRASYESVKEVYSDIILSCGSGTTPVGILLAEENHSKNIVIMKPPFPYEMFRYDLMIVPKHDKMRSRKNNIVRIQTALHSASADMLHEEGEKLKRELRLPEAKVISLLLGGDTKTYRFDISYVRATILRMKEYCKENGFSLLITTSRRTRQDVVDIFKQEFTDDEVCKLLVVATENNREHVVPGMIGAADIIVVSEDSISMISESLCSQAHVVVLKMAKNGMHEKHIRFQNHLLKRKNISICYYETLNETLASLLQSRRTRTAVMEEEQRKLEERLGSLL